MRMKKEKVVITGMGVISQAGNDIETFWENILLGKKEDVPFVTRRINESYTKRYNLLNPDTVNKLMKECFTEEQIQSNGKCACLTAAVALQAIGDAGLKMEEENSERISVVSATANGENHEYGMYAQDETFVMHSQHSIATLVATMIDAQGEVFCNTNACSAGNIALAYAYSLIKNDKADCVVVSGADVFADEIYGGFSRIKALSKDKVMPFDVKRDGTIMSEAAASIIVESYEHALNRGAHIYCEIAGVGLSNDAYSILAPDPSAEGVKLAMRRAIADAGCKKQDIGYISLHGTATEANDRCEGKAISEFFGEYAKDIYASSIKSNIGHALGPASLLETISCALILERGELPPTINTEELGEECSFTMVLTESIKRKVKWIMNNSFAFGGSNCVLIIHEVE